MAGGWPLVGRDEELALVANLLAAGRSVAVYGSAGVGKTRLGREIERHWRDHGSTTVWLVATQAGHDLPFATFAAFAASAGSTRADPVAIIAELRARLSTGGPRPGVLIVDDGHWLDEASSAVIHQIISSSAATVLMTVRSGEPAPDALAGLWKDDLLERVELQPLSTAETARLAASILGGGCRPGIGGALWDATGGNPLYVRELLEAGLAAGSVEKVDGLWGLRRGLEVGNRLSTLIGARLDRLEPDAGLVAEVVALGEPLPTATVEAMCGLAALEGAELAGFVTVVADGDRSEVRIAHPLYAEVARSRLPGARARSLYQRLAEVLEATGLRRRSDFIRWLSFRLEGGQSVPLDVLLQGWAEASEAGERRLAERLARRPSAWPRPTTGPCSPWWTPCAARTATRMSSTCSTGPWRRARPTEPRLSPTGPRCSGGSTAPRKPIRCSPRLSPLSVIRCPGRGSAASTPPCWSPWASPAQP